MAQEETPGLDAIDNGREAADITARLGPIADQLVSRGAVAQFEADIADPARTRAGSAFAGTTGPLPRFIPMRDIVAISLNIIDLLPSAKLFHRLARNSRLPTDDNLINTLPYAPTLRDALELGVRYGNAMLPWFDRSIVVTGGEVRMIYRPVTSLGRIEAISMELSLMASQRVVETIIGEAAAGTRLHFALPPPTEPGLLAERCGCGVLLGGDESYIAFPQAWWAQASPYHDPILWRDGLARCEADLVAVRDLPLVGRVRAHVAAGIEARRIVTIAETAQALNLSARSLMRALADLGTTHHTIIDCERRDRARAFLAQSAMSMAEVAEHLGFSDQSSFGRKCRGWFGASPARLRQQLASRDRPSA